MSENTYKSNPIERVNPNTPDFSGVVVGSELLTIDELKEGLRVDFNLDETEINAIQTAARLQVEKESNRLLVDRECEASTITPGEKDAAKLCVLFKARCMYGDDENKNSFPYRALLNTFSDKLFFL